MFWWRIDKGVLAIFLALATLVTVAGCAQSEEPVESGNEPLRFAPIEASIVIQEGSEATLPGLIFVAGESHPIWDSGGFSIGGVLLPTTIHGGSEEATPYGKVSSASLDISTMKNGQYSDISAIENFEPPQNFSLKISTLPKNSGELEVAGDYLALSATADYFKAGIRNTTQEAMTFSHFSMGLGGVRVDSVEICGNPLETAVLEPHAECTLEAKISETGSSSRLYVANPVLTYQGATGESTFVMPVIQYGTGQVNLSQLREWFGN